MDDPGGFDVWVNGKKYPAHFQFCERKMGKDSASPLVISPDGKRWAVRGVVFGEMTPGRAGSGGIAVMVDGKMQPTIEDVVDGTTCFTADSKDVLYAAGHVARGNYAVYRNGKPGKMWNYIRPNSLQLIRGGRIAAFTAYQGPPGHFAAFSPGGRAKSLDARDALAGCR